MPADMEKIPGEMFGDPVKTWISYMIARGDPFHKDVPGSTYAVLFLY